MLCLHLFLLVLFFVAEEVYDLNGTHLAKER